jgi:hypothetical protein
MKCRECLKNLNEMTLYCDRCGAQLSEEKMPLKFEIIEKNVLPIAIETAFSKNQLHEIKIAYFLSNIRKDFRGFKKRYIEQYIDYVLLRTYYEKNKVLLTTEDFDKKRALDLLITFDTKKPQPLVFEILKEEYGDDYENKIIPKVITDQVGKIYDTEFNLKMLSPSRFLTKIGFTVLQGVIKIAIILGVIGAIAYIGIPMVITDFDIIDFITTNTYIIIGLAAIVLFLGYVTSKKKRLYYPFEDVINQNKEFKKHLKLVVKKRIKNIKFRIRKDKNKKK